MREFPLSSTEAHKKGGRIILETSFHGSASTVFRGILVSRGKGMRNLDAYSASVATVGRNKTREGKSKAQEERKRGLGQS